MKLARYLLSKQPKLKNQIFIAHLDVTPEEYIKQNLQGGTVFAAAGFFLQILFIIAIQEYSIFWFLLAFVNTIVLFLLFYFFFSKRVTVYIRKREREMEKDVLFAGRYLLVKLQSGAPFFQSLIDASKGQGTANKFFKEIVDDVYTGTPLEEAMEKAAHLSPSRNFKLIVLQMNNALKSGVDVSQSLNSLIREITESHFLEIERYNKKLNSLTLFYMLIAIVVPSLGMAFFVVLTGFVQLQIRLIHLMIICFFLGFVQYMFLSVFRSIRPLINM